MKKYLNKQKYFECQLVTAINAATYLGQIPVDLESEEYERLVDLVCARHGSAINIDLAYNYLRLDYRMVPASLKQIKLAIQNKTPISVTIWHPKTGFHSVLIVDFRGERLKVCNFMKETTRHMWINWDNFKKFITRKKNINPNYGKFKVFSLAEWVKRYHSSQKEEL